MNPFKAVAAASLLFLSLGAVATQDETKLKPVHVDMTETCKKGLIVWSPSKAHPHCNSFQTPQVKIFDGAGRLRFSGTGMDTLKWAKSGMPSTPIPNSIVVRDASSESRITHVAAPSPGHGWLTYYATKPCPPCEEQLATLRTDVIQKLGVKTEISVFDVY